METELTSERNTYEIKKELAGQKISLPTYIPQLRAEKDLGVFREVNNIHSLKNVDIYQARILDSKEVISDRKADLKKHLGILPKNNPLKDKILILDPCFDYLVNNVASERRKMLSMKGIPEKVELVLKEDRSPSILFKNIKVGEKRTSPITKAIQWSINRQMDFNASLPLNPCIPIEDEKTFKWALRTNKIGNAITKSSGYEGSVYFNIARTSVLEKDRILNSILHYIERQDMEYVFMKIRGLTNLDNHYQVKNYERLIRGINDSDKTLFLLNTNSLGYISLGIGAGAFSEPINGHVMVDQRYGSGPPSSNRGKYLHPKLLEWWSYKEMEKLLDNNGGKLPCSCPICKNYSKKSTKSPSSWNEMRRKHAIVYRDKTISQLKENLAQGNLRGAMFDRLTREHSSEFVHYADYFK